MELLVLCCQTRTSPIAILEQPLQGGRHTARLVKDQVQIFESSDTGRGAPLGPPTCHAWDALDDALLLGRFAPEGQCCNLQVPSGHNAKADSGAFGFKSTKVLESIILASVERCHEHHGQGRQPG